MGNSEFDINIIKNDFSKTSDMSQSQSHQLLSSSQSGVELWSLDFDIFLFISKNGKLFITINDFWFLHLPLWSPLSFYATDWMTQVIIELLVWLLIDEWQLIDRTSKNVQIFLRVSYISLQIV